MDVLNLITREAKRANKKLVLIGGHAINAHGISRSTGDLDLMVLQDDIAFWKELLGRLKYSIFHETKAFVQSRPDEIAAWPIDLMLVDQNTLNKALSDAVVVPEIGADCPVASVGHLIAMKLHALKVHQEHRSEGDLSDLKHLLRIQKMDLKSDGFRQLCEKYGSIEVYERLLKN